MKILYIILVCVVISSCQPVAADFDVQVNLTLPVAVVEPFFLSYTLDDGLLTRKPRWSNLDFQ